MTHHLRLVVLFTLCLLASTALAQERLVPLTDTEVPVRVYPADGGRLLLWLPSEYGPLDVYARQAEALQAMGFESWVADPFAAYFLPVAPSSLAAMPESMVGALVEAAHAATGKTVFVVTHDKGAALALAGLRQWQAGGARSDVLGGVIMISPYLLEGTPEAGEDARYLPIAAATNLPVFVLQPVKSPLYWRLPALRRELATGGSPYFLQTLPAVRDRFFFRPDATAIERESGDVLSHLLARSVRLLATQPVTLAAAPLATTVAPAPSPRTSRELAPYRGDPVPPPLALPDLNDALRDLADERGSVVLVNFWASWCPPCVHEMPSMQQLSDRFAGRPFTILAVNLAEPVEDIRPFVEQLGLRFPVLLDPRGTAIEQWKVFAYPTSYVIDKQGNIRYALFGAIDWMEPDTVARIEALISE